MADTFNVELKVTMPCEVRGQRAVSEQAAAAAVQAAYQRLGAGSASLPPPGSSLRLPRPPSAAGAVSNHQLTPSPLRPPTPQGCVGAVRRVLEKREGVRSVEIDLPTQKVSITAQAPETREGLKELVAKTGKATEFWA